MPKGIKLLRLCILIGGLLAFSGLYVYFFLEIWSAGQAQPDIDNQLVYFASALGGVLGAFFALSFGIQQRDPEIDANKLKLGPTLMGEAPSESNGPGDALATAAVWLYALVGLGAIVTAAVKSVQSPDAVKALAATFGGYALAIFGTAFAGQSTSGP